MLMLVELLNRQREAVVIPEECLMSQGEKRFVFVVDEAADNSVERREVGIGTRRAGEVEIVTGLSVGELVITDGTLKVRAGNKVVIRAVDDGSTPIRELLDSGSANSAPP
jgi:membrane fusion protein (multidrug efflux system)